MAQKIEFIRPYLKAILAAAILTAAVWASYAWWSGQSAAEREEGSAALFAAMGGQEIEGLGIRRDPADFERIVRMYPDTNVASFAGVVAGDLYLNTGCNFLLTDKARAGEGLKKAVEHYMMVRQQTGLSGLRQRATYGLARAKEAQGQLADARELYEEVSKAGGTFSASAAARLRDLGKPSTKKFYDWLAKFDPKQPGQPGASQPPAPGSRIPFNLDSLSDEPVFPKPGATFDLDLKGQGAENKPPEDAPQTPTDIDTDKARPSESKPDEPKPIEPEATVPKPTKPKSADSPEKPPG